MVSLGTSGTIFGKAATPIIDPSGAVCPFCDATGAWLPLMCTLNCTRPAEEVRWRTVLGSCLGGSAGGNAGGACICLQCTLLPALRQPCPCLDAGKHPTP